MSAATGYAKTPDGVHLAYTVTGNGPVDVLYSGGYTISIDSWDEEPHIAHMFRRLESFSRLIRYDVRGVGLSDPIDPANPPTVELLASDVLAVLDAVDVARVAFIADSGSGTAAIELAATRARPRRTTRARQLGRVLRPARGLSIRGLPNSSSRTFSERTPIRPSSGRSETPTTSRSSCRAWRDDPHFRDWWMRASRRGGSPATARALIGLQLPCRHACPAARDLGADPRAALSDNLFVPFALGQYLAENIPGAECVGARDEGRRHVGDELRSVHRRDRGVPDRTARRECRTGARDGAVHRHRRLDGSGGRARRPRVADPARFPRRDRAGRVARATAAAW